MVDAHQQAAQAVDDFEAGRIAPGEFSHREHVRLAWAYLVQRTPAAALQAMSDGLRRFATEAGAPEKYHETVTWAWVLLIHERMAADPLLDWDAFETANPDLFDSGEPILGRYYDAEVLASDRARRVFILPTPSPTTAAPAARAR